MAFGGGPLKGARSRGGAPGRFQSESLWRLALARSESFLPRRAQPEGVPPAASGGGCGGPSPGPPGLSPNLRAGLPPPPPRQPGASAASPEMRPSRGRP
ncbi:arp2/3 complex-activating protein rickA-like [Lagenorhynchus albirostris]|uniref:arp2/3 complex-activating protein rickA-like n=1 Tax=Lagenorhynchus albirostris TaxID=27610 RepID=UPI0028E4E15A|nr:arp2/3 complex-activating protein rickA-like [Lagenorhynchus albirostris]